MWIGRGFEASSFVSAVKVWRLVLGGKILGLSSWTRAFFWFYRVYKGRELLVVWSRHQRKCWPPIVEKLRLGLAVKLGLAWLWRFGIVWVWFQDAILLSGGLCIYVWNITSMWSLVIELQHMARHWRHGRWTYHTELICIFWVKWCFAKCTYLVCVLQIHLFWLVICSSLLLVWLSGLSIDRFWSSFLGLNIARMCCENRVKMEFELWGRVIHGWTRRS